MGAQKGGRKKTARAGGAGKPAAPRAKRVTLEWTVTAARTVSVAGDFNDWDPQVHPLTRGKDGVWKVSVPLKPGRYEYMFVVDGEWVPDPRNPDRVPNPHGGFNSLLQVD